MFRITVEVELAPEYAEDDAIDSIIKELEDGVDLGYFKAVAITRPNGVIEEYPCLRDEAREKREKQACTGVR